MGRKPVISRDRLLDLAEEIVRASGSAALTIDALAKAAQISKGGVQYSFASKDALVAALVDRWLSGFDFADPEIAALSGTALVRRYLADIRSSSVASAKQAGMLLSYISDPRNQRSAREWYDAMLSRLEGPKNLRARMAFLAVDGLLLMQVSCQSETETILAHIDDIEASLDA